MWKQAVEIYEGEDEIALKLRFAKAWQKNPKDPHSVGYIIFPDDPARAWAASSWLEDRFVIAMRDELINGNEDEAEAMLPTDPGFALEVLTLARGYTDPKHQIDMMKLYAEVRGHIKTGSQTNVQINNNDNRVVKVLRVPERVTEADREDWKTDFKRSQMKLVADARSSRPAN